MRNCMSIIKSKGKQNSMSEFNENNERTYYMLSLKLLNIYK